MHDEQRRRPGSVSWRLLPGALRADLEEDPPGARTARDIAADVSGILVAVLIGALSGWPRYQGVTQPAVIADVAVGAPACLALWWRRRWPVGLALAMTLLSAVSPAAGGAAFVATLSVAVHRPLPVVLWIGSLGIATELVNAALFPNSGVPYAASVTIGALLTIATVGWGRAVRARRGLLVSLSERTRRAEEDRQARIAEARRMERVRLAREMHDVLAHRMSLLSVHAGALEFRPDAPRAEIARAAGVIRSGVHQMLEDLREVIGLLREEPGEETAPRPPLTMLPDLAEEARRAGTDVTLDMTVAEAEAVPTVVARTAYRIVQEGLTNARKHAPGMPVTVTIRGAPARGLDIEVRQPLAGRDAEIPGAGVGLAGLAERATLAGGTLDHGLEDDMFALRARLPWEA
ncbi:histidine kinase [Actinoallomurus acanthiterrae]